MGTKARIRANWIRWAVLILALASAAQLAWFSHRNGEITSCQVEYNRALAKALDERSEIATDDRESMTLLVRTVFTSRTRTDSVGALQTYLATQDELEKQRTKNPLPKLPPGNCR